MQQKVITPFRYVVQSILPIAAGCAWFELAAKSAPGAEEEAKLLKQTMTAEQVAAAQRRFKELLLLIEPKSKTASGNSRH